MAHYIAIIHKEPDSDFGVWFPDIPGCVTAGTTLDEACAFAEKALAFHIEAMIEEGEEIPAPSDLDAIMARADFRDGIAVLVPGPVDTPKVVRVKISIPEDVLQAIDRAAEQMGLTRSGVLIRATRELLLDAA